VNGKSSMVDEAAKCCVVIMELCPLGNLSRGLRKGLFVRTVEDSFGQLSQRVNYPPVLAALIDIASGFERLHSVRPGEAAGQACGASTPAPTRTARKCMQPRAPPLLHARVLRRDWLLLQQAWRAASAQHTAHRSACMLLACGERGVSAHVSTPVRASTPTECLRTSQMGVMHCDLKPGNLLLVKEAESVSGIQVKIGDFGLSKILPTSCNTIRNTNIGGTIAWAAPECLVPGESSGGRDGQRSQDA